MNDYISREAAKQILSVLLVKDAAECACNLIDSVFPADVEPVRRWIPCSERLPERPGDYQVCTKNEYYGTRNVAKRYFNGDCWSGRWTNITHWMPLPELPEEER